MATASTMTIFCLRCGHENAAENRFCGMCGAVLLRPRSAGSQSSARGPQVEPAAPQSARQPQAEFSPPLSAPAVPPQMPVQPSSREWPKAPATRQTPISGPSFLGLDSNREHDPDYLLDEVPPTSHWRLYLALALLAVAGLLFWVQWGRGQFDTSYLGSLIHRPQSAPPSPQTENAPETTPAEDQSASAGQSSTGEATAAPAPRSTSAAPAMDQPPRNAPKQPSTSPPDQGGADASASTLGADATHAAASDAQSVAKSPAPRASDTSGGIASRTRGASSGAASAAPKNPGSEALVDTAEKYLDGQGVPQSCDRALSYLRQAVDGSVRAKSKLGGLYATGHCVPLDRPTAYRWFALALHEQPKNSYVEHDLQMLWNQMTQDEKSRVVRVIQ